MAETVEATGTQAAVAGMLDKLLGPSSRENKSLLADVETMMYSVQPATIQAAQNAMAARRDFESRLSEIQVPTLVLTGEDDPIAPAQATRQWSDKIPNAEMRIIKDVGHLSPLESSAEFNREVSLFLDGLA